MKNPQTTIALTFLTHIISGIGGVFLMLSWTKKRDKRYFLYMHCSVQTKKLIDIKVKKKKKIYSFLFCYFGFHSKGGLTNTPFLILLVQRMKLGFWKPHATCIPMIH
jgi:hypothetical protein